MKLATKILLGTFISLALMFAGCDDNDRTTNIFVDPCDTELVWVGRDFGTHAECVQIYCSELDRFVLDGWTHYFDEPTCKAGINADDEDEDDDR